MPIKQIDEKQRLLPVLGSIRIGYKAKKNGKEYPQAVDHFILPEAIKDQFEANPKELTILLPSDDISIVFPHDYKLYGKTRGLICKGNGVEGKFRNKGGAYVEKECPCKYFEDKKCRMIGILIFLLPNVKTIGAFKIVTSSFYSIKNILDYLHLIKSLVGRISFIPLTLKVEMQEFHPEVNGKKMKTLNPVLVLERRESFESLIKKIHNRTFLKYNPKIKIENGLDDDVPEEVCPKLLESENLEEVDDSEFQDEKTERELLIDELREIMKSDAFDESVRESVETSIKNTTGVVPIKTMIKVHKARKKKFDAEKKKSQKKGKEALDENFSDDIPWEEEPEIMKEAKDSVQQEIF